MAGLAPIVFDFGAPATCARAFTRAGRDYKAGEPFSYEGMQRHEVHGLWLAHLIRFEAPKVEAATPKQKRQRAAQRASE